jgi:hypothetical protein
VFRGLHFGHPFRGGAPDGGCPSNRRKSIEPVQLIAPVEVPSLIYGPWPDMRLPGRVRLLHTRVLAHRRSSLSSQRRATTLPVIRLLRGVTRAPPLATNRNLLLGQPDARGTADDERVSQAR